ncbi:hypothetical protein HY620_00160 [Candidatus Uhrbacteria bacterium]|nr:hypothetical protein [Candidatus Uhrbacteria bacterium]
MNESMKNEPFVIPKTEHEPIHSLWSRISSEIDLLASYFDPLEDLKKTRNLIDLIGAQQFVRRFSSQFANLDPSLPQTVRFLSVVAEGAPVWVIKCVEGTPLNTDSESHRDILRSLAHSGSDGASWILDQLGTARLHIQRDWSLISPMFETGVRDRLYEYINCDSVKLDTTDILDNVSVLASHNASWVREHFDDKLDISNSDHEVIFASAIDGGGLEWVKGKLQKHIPLSTDFYMIATKVAEAGLGEWIAHALDVSAIKIPSPAHLLLLDAIVRNGGAAWVEEHFKKELSNSALLPEIQWRLAFDKKESFPTLSNEELLLIQQKEEKSKSSDRHAFTMLYERAFEELDTFCDLEDEDKNELKNRIVAVFAKIPDTALSFLLLSLQKQAFFSHSTIRFLDSLEQGHVSCSLKMLKGGSELTLLIQPNENSDTSRSFSATFINDIPSAGADAWRAAAEKGIPVAPILALPTTRPHDMKRAYSRYCGTTLGRLKQYDSPALNALLYKKGHEILQALKREGITHGHPHDQNFTVEFVEKKWLDTQLAKGNNVNTLPAQSSAISFDVLDFLKEPERFTPIVRLIDWDAARCL